jgi:PST family polysaccharide transporter
VLQKHRIDPSIIFDNHTQEGEFKDNVVKGSFATGLSQGLAMGFSIVSAVVLARLLDPDDFGLIGMVTVFVNFLFIFKDIGLSDATIQKEHISSSQISTLFWINSLISITLALILLVGAPLVAKFYERPELTAITSVLAISFVIEGLSIQHTALLRRHLRFTAVAIADIASRASYLVTAIILALMGFSYWSLVGGHIVRATVLLLLIFYHCPWIPGWMQNLDSILIGKLFGAPALGVYGKAYQLLMLPLTQIKLPLTHLALPVLSSLKNEPERYRNYFNKLLDLSISVALPVTVYCFLESEFLIRLILGPKWMEAVPIFRILSVGGIFVSASFLPGLALLSHGYSKKYMKLLIATSVIQSVSFVAGSPFGVNGIAIAYSASSFLMLIPMVIMSFTGTIVKARMFFLTILWPLLTAFASGALAFALLKLFSADSMLQHFLVAGLFFIIYTGLSLVRRESRLTLLSIWESLVGRKNKKSEQEMEKGEDG